MTYYKGMRVNAFGLPVLKYKKQNRIKKKNRKRNFYHTAFSSPFTKDLPKNLILMYDVTEEKKKERDWFRRQLKNFDYIMIQRSIWVGPSPLPKEFLDYVKAIGLSEHLKTFKLAKAYTGKGNNI
ncbi:CRISPR-associated endonuclease Cas2 [Candidatus Nomurabacteria bacterium RIFCSPHIGHO2_02_FULL_37_13]|uniref:CRISPR-associated endonuclease Cas2 n=1 Tax=Candidatus Nomurabacteria bacterium RIFCSPHIGHO2_02_FULL_37_13 TaxID=1801750 RepID=A0A1F6W4B0_9BACT|nr:MAG: CRISPR-associated endonuclease Cas2 [Candidatus Nomurabacteria bacterium RIFCSPHIGHO2_01_FULL_36_23]OGI76642.1 MAG: CRISPR-associated endonuclease Cas2 [Candidatus Nomurabacteria bacterium RIFCSPHIGHO2_02_FULL_37_13]OGI87495.1 MAG: CRISPR-associated endonuclease Cas2 [Candidatus Nomurabacteria bacterium RIFCSPLOWO2_01_FULL_37_25]